MSHEILFENTTKDMAKLPKEKLQQVSDYIEFLLAKYEDEILRKGIMKLASESKSFDFLRDEEEDLYTVDDLKVRYR